MCGNLLPHWSDSGSCSRDREGTRSGALHRNRTVCAFMWRWAWDCSGVWLLLVSWSELELGWMAWSSLGAAWLVSLFFGVICSPKQKTEGRCCSFHFPLELTLYPINRSLHSLTSALEGGSVTTFAVGFLRPSLILPAFEPFRLYHVDFTETVLDNSPWK